MLIQQLPFVVDNIPHNACKWELQTHIEIQLDIGDGAPDFGGKHIEYRFRHRRHAADAPAGVDYDDRDDSAVEEVLQVMPNYVEDCSVCSMHRILAGNGEPKERRDQRHHAQYKKPKLVAKAPNQVWSWDITKLLGPAKKIDTKL